jgi:hypothetical protein
MKRAGVYADESARVINGIERKLSGTLRQLHPDADFIARVRKRLTSTPALRVERDDSFGLALGLLGVAGFLLAAILGRWIWRYLTRS